jgi:5-methyltetrahydrofolate--homocysteine methyltransferase
MSSPRPAGHASSPAPWGPQRKPSRVTGGTTFAAAEGYYRQALGLVDGGVDLLLVETCQDTRNVKAALLGIERRRARIGLPRP